MAKMFKMKSEEQVEFRCYSERGLMSYYMFKVLPKNIIGFLKEIKWPTKRASFFQELQDSDITNPTVFSELHFGSSGFGSPDGALFVQVKSDPILILIEVKLNESYQSSSKKKYPSSINGQLELKWRLMSTYKRQDPQKSIIIENDQLIESYRSKDPFYNNCRTQSPIPEESRRRLKLKDGVKEFFNDFVAKTKLMNIFYLAVTREKIEKQNPLDQSEILPQLTGLDGQPVSEDEQVCCWLPASFLENKS